MHFKKIVHTVLLSMIGICAYAQQMDLNYAIQYAMTHNYDFQKSQLDKAISYEKTFEVLTAGFPKVNGTVSYQNMFILNTSVLPGEFVGKPGTLVPVQFGTSNNASVGVNVQQLIFDGRYLVGVQARDAVKKFADAQVKMSERDVRELISKSFYQAVIAQNSLKQLIMSKEVLDKLYSDAQKTYAQGLIEELDVERLQYNVKTLDNTINSLKTQSDIALLALKLNMGYPLDSALNLYYTMDAFDTRVAEMRKMDIDQNNHYQDRAEFQLLDESIRLKKYDIKQTRAGYLPSLYGSFNYGYQALRPEFNFFSGEWYKYGNFGFQLNLPIFDGFTRKSQVSQLKLGLEKLELEKRQMKEALKLQSINSKLSLINSVDEYENQSNILKLAEKIERKTQIKYKEGVGSSYEFANAQNERIQQYLKMLQSRLNLLIKYTEYLKASGNL